MLLKWNFNALRARVNLSMRVSPRKDSFMLGVGNRTGDGKYVLFLDYDDTPISWVMEEIHLLQAYTNVGTAYVFKTKHGYHVMFLEKFFLGAIVDMMRMTSCDTHYKDVPLLYGRRVWVLRATPKNDEEIRYIGAFFSQREDLPGFERSNAHRHYLQKEYGLGDEDFARGGKFDTSDDILLAYYHIAER